MMNEEKIAIKGIKDGLLIALDESEEWQSVITDLTTRIDGQSAFFAGAKITVDLGQRPVPKYQLGSLKAALERRGLNLAAVLSDSTTTLDAAHALDLRTNTAGAMPGREPIDTKPIDPEESGIVGVMIRRTLRSGRTVHSDGHVVVYGDVNPGGQIFARGDVVVWGVLRGTVHAGIDGDEEAIVCALDMIPTQLRIAGYTALPKPQDRGGRRRKAMPEVASIRDQEIVIEAWKQ